MNENPHYILEKSAKWRRCPMAMGQKVDPDHSFCLGSECMAWRWRPAGHQDQLRAYVLPMPLVPEEQMTHGYCGMAR